MSSQEVESIWKAFYQWQSKEVPKEVPDTVKSCAMVLKYEIEEGKLSVWTTLGGHQTYQIKSTMLRSKEEITSGIRDFAQTLVDDDTVPWLRPNDSVYERMAACYGKGRMVLLPARYFDNILNV